jgi:hypothetical protein
MYCDKCSNIVLQHRTGMDAVGVEYDSRCVYYDHHDSLKDLELSGRYCSLCYRLWSAFRAYPKGLFDDSVLYPVQARVSLGMGTFGSTLHENLKFTLDHFFCIGFVCGDLCISTTPADKIDGMFITLSISDDIDCPALEVRYKTITTYSSPSGSNTCPNALDVDVELASMWYQNCLRDHQLCVKADQNAKLPLRVLDVSNKDSVKLVTGQGQRVPYTTLSYKWGEGAKYLLTERNKSSLEAGVPEETFPRTFTQAAQLARGIGIPYLWIDALCIQQDAPQELDQQVAQMDDIFRGSKLTLFAAAGESAQWGLEVPESRNMLLPFTLDIVVQIEDVEISKTFYLRDFGYKDLSTTLEYDYLLPLYQRGWVLQEQTLSYRALVFTGREIYWRCLCEINTERDPGQRNVTAPSSALKSFSNLRMWLAGFEPSTPDHVMGSRWIDELHRADILDDWYQIVENYASRELSYLSDILPGLSGLASSISKISNYHYVAGFWTEDIQLGLLWRTETDNSYTSSAVTTTNTSLPSWSWISRFGTRKKIVYEIVHTEGRLHACGVQLLDTNIKQPSNCRNPFGEVISASLTIKACVRWATVHLYTPWPSGYHLCDRGSNLSNLSDSIAIFFPDDTTLDGKPFVGIDVLCVLCAAADGVTFALAVLPVLHQERKYKRVGLAQFNGLDWFGEMVGEELRPSSDAMWTTIELV